MIFRNTRKEELQLNLTPLIDVVFLLLIFFMVSTSFTKESEINIELPESSGTPLKTEKFVIEIEIDREGRYFVNQQRVKDNKVLTLKRAIRLIQGNKKNPQLIISSDRKTSYEAVVKAMDAARQLGLVNLTFATKQTKE
ncbi:MAG: biopolymer transporter ExbD [Gammaproteobacteria bacterium]|nr:biopolymer transporter ExbD [Gammaproteobacteria bacterium]MDH5777265.1 biopolymer transporter ExbD [Gammaproteobacteria bacterium]